MKGCAGFDHKFGCAPSLFLRQYFHQPNIFISLWQAAQALSLANPDPDACGPLRYRGAGVERAALSATLPGIVKNADQLAPVSDHISRCSARAHPARAQSRIAKLRRRG
jgi:hypothetical protein